MKKLVALILVLGMSSLASAELIVTVNGEPQPDEITLSTSEMIELDLEIAAGQDILGATIEWTLSNNQAEFVYGNVEFPVAFEMPPVTTGDPQRYYMSGAQLVQPKIDGPAVLLQGLMVHCLEITDVILTVEAQAGTIDGSWQPIELFHTLKIVQIPEPMTVALLGLGGLFLLRRRK
jgi:hypothetical protein